jgi:hypothetical protein
MIDETKMADPSELSPRAAIALMSLKLRSTVQEAIEAEAEADAVDADAALWQLRSRLGPLMDDRRRSLDEQVAAERERAAAEIAAAHAEADRIVAAAVAEAAARVAAEEAARVAAEEAARVAAAEAARVAAEEAARVAAEEAARVAAEEAARVAAEEAARVAAEEAARIAAEAEAAHIADVGAAGTATDQAATLSGHPDVAEDGAVESTSEPELGGLTPMLLFPMAEVLDVVPHAETPLFDDPMVEWAPDESVEAVEEESVTSEQLPAPPATLVMPSIEPLVPPPPPSAVGSPWSAPDLAPSGRSSMHVVIDADSFARAFAAAIAPALEHREAQLPQGWMPYPAPAPAPKKSFWSHAWHPDVLLSGLAMVIVIIVLIAWTG